MANMSPKAKGKTKPEKNKYLVCGLIIVAIAIAVVAWFTYFGIPQKSTPTFSPSYITYITTSVTPNGSIFASPTISLSTSSSPNIDSAKDSDGSVLVNTSDFPYPCMPGSFVPRLAGSDCVSADHIDEYNAFAYTFEDLNVARYFEVLKDAGFTLYKTSQDNSGKITATKYFFAKQTNGDDGLCGILVSVDKSSTSNVIAVGNIADINKFDFVITESDDGKTSLSMWQ